MKIEVIISTRNRWNKLLRTLKSIDPAFTVNIIFDGDESGFNKMSENPGLYHAKIGNLKYLPGHHGNVVCRNLMASGVMGNMVFATDDITFYFESIQNAWADMMKHFPDTDGVIGFMQDGNLKFHPAGIVLVGSKFADRYPKRQVYYPGYFHFACQEIQWYAESLGKFYLSKRAIIYHHNPNVDRKEMDKTHIEGRINRKRDHDLIDKRKKTGKVWPLNS
jgi:hypothetical protein